MDDTVRAWLLAQLGPTDLTELSGRYERLRSARAVALEVLSERRARLLAEPLRLVVDGVVTMDQTGNLTGLERQLAGIQANPGPDDAVNGDTAPHLAVAALVPTRRVR
ncbi:hypothetical protein GCM10010193_57420 [Kitasatospora atroaurantiaca]|uniref:Uncharacterized protein n=1 Tax=Kitasatospora atroaurantiaca TaxID=285545 RepID=A0A561EN40_9ACTN|nr:hypothetical protein [Kitasatospora atroaurantiaca]TWE16989.1 hypothetical protein FB465_1984 [Kitasatospora atroaurantiaca]